MSLIAAALDVSPASLVIALAPLCVISAMVAGRCSKRLNLALDIISLVLSVAMAGVLFHAIDSARNGDVSGVMRYAYYLTAGPIMLALWAADGLLHRLALSSQSRNHSATAGWIAAEQNSVTPHVETIYSRLSRGINPF